MIEIDKEAAFTALRDYQESQGLDVNLKSTNRVFFFLQKLLGSKKYKFIDVALKVEHFVNNHLTFLLQKSYQDLSKVVSSLIDLKFKAKKIKDKKLRDQTVAIFNRAISRAASIRNSKGVVISNPLTLWERISWWFRSLVGFFLALNLF